jgi:pSer/pThr/pTyr-binding forkhead associated (FHA) protein/tetratricopeptide (TPR) repeat protein
MGAPKLVLDISRDGQPARQMTLQGEAVVGRAEGCVIRLDDRAISRQHAVFRTNEAGEVQVEKRSDFAPLSVNGSDVTSAVLRLGDVVEIGPYRLRVQDLSKAAPEAPPTREEASVQPEENQPVLQDSEETPASLSFEPALSQDAGFSAENTDEMQLASEDEATKLGVAQGILEVGLVFAPGSANVEYFELNRDLTVLGREVGCEVVLNDRKASRRHAQIARAGNRFILKDLGSANGTWVNGTQAAECELSGGDRIRIASVEFEFRAVSPEFQAREAGLLKVEEQPENTGSASGIEMASQFSSQFSSQSESMGGPSEALVSEVSPSRVLSVPSSQEPIAAPSLSGPFDASAVGDPLAAPGAAQSQPAVKPGGRRTLMGRFLEWYRALSPKRQALWTAIILGGIYLFLFDDDPETQAPTQGKKVVASAPAPGASPGLRSFESLSEKDKQFVRTQRDLAQAHFSAKEYDKALFEVRKIFEIIPDFENAREIERYAVEAKRRLEVAENERKEQELKELAKRQAEELLAEVRILMQKKDYDRAQLKFPEILAKDPDNAEVLGWKREIQEQAELKAQEARAAEVRRQVNLHAWEELKRAQELAKRSCREGIIAFREVIQIGSSDRRPGLEAEKGLNVCREEIRAKVEPALRDAEAAEKAGESRKAYEGYRTVVKWDPEHEQARAGIERVRETLHLRAKAAYTEAVLAESYSDFSLARTKYQETLDMSPDDDLYHERARRKLARFLKEPQ